MPDKFEGQGGSYVIDENGNRRLVERTAENETEAAAIASEIASAAPQAAPAPTRNRKSQAEE